MAFKRHYSCNNQTNSAGENDKSKDSTGLITQTDSINTPGGIINSSPISTDTVAINVQNSLKKKDSVENKK